MLDRAAYRAIASSLAIVTDERERATVARTIADHLQRCNSRFDRRRFFEMACIPGELRIEPAR